MKITKQRIRQIIKEEIENLIECSPWQAEIDAAETMYDEEAGPKKVKKLKDYEDGVHTGTASLVDVIGLEESLAKSRFGGDFYDGLTADEWTDEFLADLEYDASDRGSEFDFDVVRSWAPTRRVAQVVWATLKDRDSVLSQSAHEELGPTHPIDHRMGIGLGDVEA